MAAKALQSDDGLADAHFAMANVLFRYDWSAWQRFSQWLRVKPHGSGIYPNPPANGWIPGKKLPPI